MEAFLAIFNLIFVAVLVFLNALFVCAEFSFVKVRATRIHELADKGSAMARLALFGIEHLDAYLSVCQLGITLTSLGLGWIGEPAFARLLSPLFNLFNFSQATIHSMSVIFGFAIITFLHVVFGELAPKSIAIQKAEKMVLILSPMMRFFYFIFYPLVSLLNNTSNSILKIFKIPPATDGEHSHTTEELKMLVDDSYEGGHIEENEQEIIQNVLSFDEKTVRDIMTPRLDVVSINSGDKLSDIVSIVQKNKFTRYPIVEEDSEKVIGILHLKDAFGVEIDEPVINIARDITIIPEFMTLEKLLKKFQETRQQMALVVDEYGDYQGIVTMEGVLEEIVGEIQDEFNNEEPEFVKKGDFYIISGKMPISEMCDELDLSYNYDEKDISTVAGFALDIIGEIPSVGESFEYEDYQFTVSEMDEQRLMQLKAKHKVDKE